MSTNFEAPGKDFSSVITADGSPTALGPTGEAMHSLEGALAETLYIYGPVADHVFEHSWAPKFLSLGLGLGYVEMMTVARGIKYLKNWSGFYLHSYESELFLRRQLTAFLENPHTARPIYQKILESTASSHEIPADQLYEKLRELQKNQQWIIDSALDTDSAWPHEKFSGLFFDAFSSRSSPELWTKDFLDFFLTNFAAPRCVISTYAATGNLKRALRTHQFQIDSRKGFGKKRQSTLGLRDSLSAVSD